MAMVNVNNVNGFDDSLENLELELGKKNKKKLIELGRQYGFEFDKHDSKADMVVEIAAAMQKGAIR